MFPASLSSSAQRDHPPLSVYHSNVSLEEIVPVSSPLHRHNKHIALVFLERSVGSAVYAGLLVEIDSLDHRDCRRSSSVRLAQFLLRP